MQENNDIENYIRLFIPILTILICMASLCLSTWAWYTTSVTSGISTISSGVAATIDLIKDVGEVTENGNNSYIASPGAKFTLNFKAGEASNGYYALIDITNQTSATSLSESIMSLFVSKVYAEEYPIRKAVYFKEDMSITIENNESTNKQIIVNIVWANRSVDDSGGIIHELGQSYAMYDPVENYKVIIGSNNTKVLIANFYDIETNKLLPSGSSNTETYNLEEAKEAGLVGVYEFEGTTCEVKAPEGYMIVVKNEQDEDSYVESVTFDDLLEEETTVSVFCISKDKLSAEKTDTPNQEEKIQEGNGDIETEESTDNQTSTSEEANNENITSSEGPTENVTESNTSESVVPPADGNNGETSTEDPSLEQENSETETQQTQTKISNIETTTEQSNENQENVQTTSTEEQTSSD